MWYRQLNWISLKIVKSFQIIIGNQTPLKITCIRKTSTRKWSCPQCWINIETISIISSILTSKHALKCFIDDCCSMILKYTCSCIKVPTQWLSKVWSAQVLNSRNDVITCEGDGGIPWIPVKCLQCQICHLLRRQSSSTYLPSYWHGLVVSLPQTSDKISLMLILQGDSRTLTQTCILCIV